MKTSSAPDAAPVTRAKAVNYLILNLLATPGLGTWLAGRKTEGAGQLILSVGGFGGICTWFVFFFTNQYRQINELPLRPSHHWLGWGGLILFAVAWCWSLVSSVIVVRDASASEGS
jgi:hypothetical protein